MGGHTSIALCTRNLTCILTRTLIHTRNLIHTLTRTRTRTHMACAGHPVAWVCRPLICQSRRLRERRARLRLVSVRGASQADM